MDFGAIVMAMSIPSAITGFAFWWLERRIVKREKLEDEKEKARKQHEFLVIQGVNAAIALGEATAKAVQRIPDAHCNGDMHAALEYAEHVKHEQKDFMNRQGIENIY